MSPAEIAAVRLELGRAYRAGDDMLAMRLLEKIETAERERQRRRDEVLGLGCACCEVTQ
jgi:hypothetical protein